MDCITNHTFVINEMTAVRLMIVFLFSVTIDAIIATIQITMSGIETVA